MEFVKLSNGETIYATLIDHYKENNYTFAIYREINVAILLKDGWHEYTKELLDYYEKFFSILKDYIVHEDTMQIITESLIVARVQKENNNLFCVFKDNTPIFLSFKEYHHMKRYMTTFEEFYWVGKWIK